MKKLFTAVALSAALSISFIQPSTALADVDDMKDNLNDEVSELSDALEGVNSVLKLVFKRAGLSSIQSNYSRAKLSGIGAAVPPSDDDFTFVYDLRTLGFYFKEINKQLKENGVNVPEIPDLDDYNTDAENYTQCSTKEEAVSKLKKFVELTENAQEKYKEASRNMGVMENRATDVRDILNGLQSAFEIGMGLPHYGTWTTQQFLTIQNNTRPALGELRRTINDKAEEWEDTARKARNSAHNIQVFIDLTESNECSI